MGDVLVSYGSATKEIHGFVGGDLIVVYSGNAVVFGGTGSEDHDRSYCQMLWIDRAAGACLGGGLLDFVEFDSVGEFSPGTDEFQFFVAVDSAPA